MLPAQVLRAVGFTPVEVDAIAAEVATVTATLLERDELWAEAIEVAWRTRQRRADVGAGYLRVRVRYALRNAIRREGRAQGRSDLTFYWPWWRPVGEVRRCKEDGCTAPTAPHAQRCPAHLIEAAPPLFIGRCEVCGREMELPGPGKRGRRPRWCSNSCRCVAHRRDRAA
jgi:hypothetical protein